MKVGGTRRVIIPPSLGYGDKSQGGIPANSVLVFDITLVTAQ
jgi:FKBP-type peptidyl-prolyl cis-trans isomerase